MTTQIISGSQISVSISDQSGVGECRRAAKAMAQHGRFDEVNVGRAAIIVTEIATNILRHAGSGTVLIQMLDDSNQPELEMLGIDRGPGMGDIDVCMRDGFSTAGTAGTGLGAVARLSRTFDVYSTPGKGTVLVSRITDRAAGSQLAPPALQVGAICLAVRGELECGDSWRVAHAGTLASIMVADGLGHGPAAALASTAAATAFAANPFDPPSSLMKTLHRAVSGTRGAAVACALLHSAEATIDYAGVGNVCGSVVIHGKQRGMVSHNGTLGMQLLRAQQFEYRWPIESIVVLHSDGLSARWSLEAYPGLTQRHPAIIAGILYRDFGRERDDATVVVVRRPS